jgi:hypothetical protein
LFENYPYSCLFHRLIFTSQAEYIEHCRNYHTIIYICDIHGDEFNSREELHAHIASHTDEDLRRPVYRCEKHKKIFGTELALQAHMNSPAHSSMPRPINKNGKWEDRELSDVFKSFGFFKCSCEKAWYSAHAFKKYKQACKRCNNFIFALYLWKNNSKGRKSNDRDDVLQGSHPKELCEACMKGICIRNRSG